jgi:hypothetical protein
MHYIATVVAFAIMFPIGIAAHFVWWWAIGSTLRNTMRRVETKCVALK